MLISAFSASFLRIEFMEAGGHFAAIEHGIGPSSLQPAPECDCRIAVVISCLRAARGLAYFRSNRPEEAKIFWPTADAANQQV